MNPPVCLTVAGSDCGGAAGIAADLATFAAHGTHGASVITAVTAQDTTGVRDVHPIPVASVEAQLSAVLDDLPVAAVKTGMIASVEIVAMLSRRLGGRLGGRPAAMPLVVDPVLVATSGAVLGNSGVARAYREHLVPVATVVTPNLDEARALTGRDAPAPDLAAELAELGPAVVLTGGGLEGTCTDWLAEPGREPLALTHPAVSTHNDHGTGCTYSAALTAGLAFGTPLAEACRRAAAYTTDRLRHSQAWTLGRGRGPIAHTHNLRTQNPHTQNPHTQNQHTEEIRT